jgi:hypothetical protein
MSIPSIAGPSRVPAVTADAPEPNPPVRQNGAPPEVEIDPVTQQPMPPRFPWLSRLSQQLEEAARQKPAFQPAPMLGDNLDRSA